jgi:hypothetical protein
MTSMTSTFLASCTAAGLLAVAVFSAPAAQAAITCKDGFQMSGGQWISTPYCNDAHLAQIARKHGVRVSDQEVRNNPAKKYEVCRFLSGDMNARDYCPDDGGSNRGRR